jgi:DNA-binding SARP family transcriptional activator
VTLQIRLFDHLQIQSGENLLAGLRPRAQRLLAYLLLHRRAALSRKNLAFTLWPDVSEEDSLGMLRRAISDLRAGLPGDEEYLTVTRESVGWNSTASYSLDVDEYERQIQRSESEGLLRAAELYTGDLLRGMDEEWIQPERERYRQAQFNALRQLSAHYQARREYSSAMEFARRALALDPFSELVYQDRMRLHFLSGDRAAALAEYERLQSLLENELGVEPMAETRALAESIGKGEVLVTETHSSTPIPIPPRLVGRDSETSQLLSLWEGAASRGQGCLAIISGESGIGKSHLVRMLAYEVSQRGGLPLVGHCYEFEKTLPHQPVVEALRPAAAAIRALPLSSPYHAILARLFPDLFESKEGAALSLSPDELRLQLFEALLQTFIILAQQQPILLIFEDIHWASESVLDWVTFIAPRLQGNRLMLAITYRTDEVDAAHAIPRLARRFERENIVTTFPLQRLTREVNREWVAHLSGLEESSAVGMADRLFSETAGNPFFLQEIVRGMLETGQIRIEKGKWSGAFVQRGEEADVITLPDSLRETILARTERLSEMARSFLQAAVAAGRTFQFEIVAHAGGWAQEASLNALEELRARGFVRESDMPGAFLFTHHLLREVIYVELTAPRRVYWHLNLAKSFQARLPEDSAALAHHFVAAGEKQLGIEYLRKAAQRAESLYAYEEASRYLRGALDLLGNDDHSATRIELLEALGDDYRFMRQGIDAMDQYELALTLWQGLGSSNKITFVRLHRKIRQSSSGMWESTELKQNEFAARKSKELVSGLAELLRVIDELEPHEETVRLLRELAVDSLIFHFPEEKERALGYARRAVQLAEQIDSPAALATALVTVVNVYGAMGLLRERVNVALRALSLCDHPRFDSAHLRIQIMITTAKSLIDVGEYHRAVYYLEEAEARARQIHAVHEESQALSLLHQCWFRLDRWSDMWETEAKRRKLQETYLLHRIGAPCFAIGLSSAVHQWQGDFDKARALRDESYNIMVSVAGPPENWKRSQRY